MKFLPLRIGLVIALAAALVAIAPSGVGTTRAAPTSLSAVVEFVNVSATSSLSFTPASFTVAPGATVHLAVTQLANFEHTFTLSPFRNFSIPSAYSSNLTQFFEQHPPIVNLSLGSTPGAVFTTTFTAPAAGTYEFVCLIHFPSMFGTMTSSASTSPSSPSGGSSGSSMMTLIFVTVGVVVAIGVAAAIVLVRRRRVTPPPPPTPPSS
jgi:plastocyanin